MDQNNSSRKSTSVVEKESSRSVAASLNLYRRAGELIAGKTHLFGRRAELHAFGISPVYSNRQRAGHLWDVDGNEYIDFNMGTGAVFLGHAYPSVVKAVQDQAALGTGLTLNHPLEIETAELLAEIVPCAEMVRFCKGGGESNMVAVRIARAATGRDKVVFCGYHGWHDWYISANLGTPTALENHLLPGITPRGVPSQLEGTTFPFEYNNLDSLKRVLEANRGEVACVIMEAARSYTPAAGFLEGVREVTREHGAILIFDEVVTGFRVARGGAQTYYGVTPDMATFAKAISNGFALGAVAGRREIMEVALDTFISSVYWAEATGLAAGRATLREYLSRDISGAVAQFGQPFMEVALDTFISSVYWAEATGLAAGRATLREYRSRDVSGAVAQFGQSFMDGCRKLISESGVPMKVSGFPAFPLVAFDGIDAALRDPLVTLYMQETARRGLTTGSGSVFCFEHTEEDLRRGLEIIGQTFETIRRALDDGDPVKFLECPVRQSGFKRLV